MFVRSSAIGLLFFAQIGMAQTPDAARVAAGQRLFESNCTACHGQNAKGGRGPDLTGRLRHGSLETEMADNITGGIAGTQMPAFPMPPENVRAIVAYLRSLSAGGPDLPIAGNAANGQQVFFGAGNCSSCHMYQGHGGRLGPDLSRIGEARTARQLQAAIAQPHREQVRGFEAVEVRLRNGSPDSRRPQESRYVLRAGHGSGRETAHAREERRGQCAAHREVADAGKRGHGRAVGRCDRFSENRSRGQRGVRRRTVATALLLHASRRPPKSRRTGSPIGAI